MVEAVLTGREAWGADIDPLARLIAEAKATPPDIAALSDAFNDIEGHVDSGLDDGWRPAIPQFDYWFRADVARDLAAIRVAIRQTDAPSAVKATLWVAFSSLIVARTSVANARDLVHSRHHYRPWKTSPDVIGRFKRRLQQFRKLYTNYAHLIERSPGNHPAPRMVGGDARRLDLANDSVELVFTSPPYGSALDYTRAHMFAVAWMPDVLGVDAKDYRLLGRKYVGSERGPMSEARSRNDGPPQLGLRATDAVIDSLSHHRERAWILYRYFRDMHKVLAEAFRVVKVGGHVVLVVCPSNIRKVSIPTPELLAEAIESLHLPNAAARPLALHQRTLHERRRVMPYLESAFGRRMRTEYVLIAQKVATRGEQADV